jgi:hypothetical protein
MLHLFCNIACCHKLTRINYTEVSDAQQSPHTHDIYRRTDQLLQYIYTLHVYFSYIYGQHELEKRQQLGIISDNP